MRWAKILIGFSAVFTLFTSANASEILVPAHVSEIISAEAVKVKKIVPIARPMLDQTKRLFRTWISPSIDLSRAQMRESRLYSRNTYSQQVNEQQLRLPTERWVTPISGLQQPVMAQAQFSAQTKSQSGNPVKTIYREGPTYFRFQKIKERRAQTRIKDSDAIRLTRDFLMENGFLIETEKDRIGRIEINERRINEDGGEGGKSDDYLVQQDISFRRVFEGKPVINSIITVGLLPDTKEIVLIKHFHWTPLEEKKEVPASSQQVKSVGPVSSSSIVEGIKKKLRASCGSFTKAEIKQVVPAWFQTEDNLIPVLVSVIHTEYPSGYKGPYTDITNLVGSDDIFLGDRKSAVIKPMSPEHDTDPSGTGYSKEGFCRQYAEGALRQISERVERIGPAPANDPVWKKDFNHHYNWCLQAPESLANDGSKQRQDWLNQHRQRGALPDPMPKPVDPRSLPGDPRPKPEGSKEGFCRQYAEGALRQISERVERTGPAPANDPVWKKDFNHHYNWCLQAPESASTQGSKLREDWLDQHRQKGALPDPMPKPVDPRSLPGDPRPKPEGSKEGFCRQYAEGALRQISERVERTGPAPANDPVWKKDFNHHYNWCLQAPQSLANDGSKQRQDWLNQHRQRGALPDPMPKPVDPRSLPGNPKP